VDVEESTTVDDGSGPQRSEPSAPDRVAEPAPAERLEEISAPVSAVQARCGEEHTTTVGVLRSLVSRRS
jgi:hypothetical protein